MSYVLFSHVCILIWQGFKCRYIFMAMYSFVWARQLSQYSDWLQTEWLGFGPGWRQRIFPLPSAFTQLWDPPSLLQWVPRIFPKSKCAWGAQLTTQPLSVLWVKKDRGYTSSPPMCQNWRTTGKLYLYLTNSFGTPFHWAQFYSVPSSAFNKLGCVPDGNSLQNSGLGCLSK
jgi:hypothetical protein